MAPSFLVSALVAAGLSAQAPEPAPRVFLKPAEQKKDVPYVPTPPEVVAAMIALAEVKKGDVVYDLGCGDGRIVIAAVRIAGVRACAWTSTPSASRTAAQRRARPGSRSASASCAATCSRCPSRTPPWS